MDFFDVIEKRQAIRQFADTPIEREKLDAILDAAVNRAPSAGNMQSYRVYVAERDDDRRALRQVARDREYITSARVVLVFCTDSAAATERWGERGERYAIQDAAIACTYAMLAATAQGLASVPVGSFDDKGLWRVIGSPEGVAPVLMLPLGYAAESPERRERRPMGELVYHMGR